MTAVLPAAPVPPAPDAAPDGPHELLVWAAVVAATRLELPAWYARMCGTLGAKAPDVLVQVAELPRNANGKVPRETLARLANEALAAGRTAVG